MSQSDPCLIRSRGPSGEPVLRLGVPLVDEYLEFLEGRCRPNTVLAAAYDLKVFFTVVAKAPAEVTPADVLGFITAQRTGRSGEQRLQPVRSTDEPAGVATSTVAHPAVESFDVHRPGKVSDLTSSDWNLHHPRGASLGPSTPAVVGAPSPTSGICDRVSSDLAASPY